MFPSSDWSETFARILVCYIVCIGIDLALRVVKILVFENKIHPVRTMETKSSWLRLKFSNENVLY